MVIQQSVIGKLQIIKSSVINNFSEIKQEDFDRCSSSLTLIGQTPIRTMGLFTPGEWCYSIIHDSYGVLTSSEYNNKDGVRVVSWKKERLSNVVMIPVEYLRSTTPFKPKVNHIYYNTLVKKNVQVVVSNEHEPNVLINYLSNGVLRNFLCSKTNLV